MAAEPFTTTRRTLLGAAAALPIAALPAPATGTVPERGLSPCKRGQLLVTVPNWTRRLAVYRRLAARAREAAETGFYRQANDRYEREKAALAAHFGSWPAARESEQGRPLCGTAFERVEAAEQAFYDRCTAPMHRAAARLALTPAPNLEAVLAKIRITHEHELGEMGCMARPVLEVLAEDVARLGDAA